MTGKFKPSDLVVSVTESNRKIKPEIENQIETVWQNMQKMAEEKGKICYNGISYRLNSLELKEDKVILDFGTFEYKVRDGLIAIPEYFDLPEEYWRKGCFTNASVKTSDEKYLMVELSGKSMNRFTVDLIGGIMDTTIGMSTGQDIFASLYNELQEEAGINQEDIKESYLQTIYIAQRTNIGFYFELTLRVPSNDLLERFKKNNDPDIKSICVYEREEYLETLKKHTGLDKQLTATLLQI